MNQSIVKDYSTKGYDVTHKIGFACKYMHTNQNLKKQLLEDIQRPLNTKSTTVAWLNRQSKAVAEERLWDIIVHNVAAIEKLIRYVGGLPVELRMVRIGSDILPVFTERTWSYFYRDAGICTRLERMFSQVGQVAREFDVRLSFHPGQFTVLASDNADIVNRSIEEFEYHVNMVRWMGYGQTWQDFKVNVHISGRQGPDGIKAVLPRLSPEARNTITIENDENSWGVDASLELEKDVALVLDIHHHWIKTGEYISATDDRVKRIQDSWRSVRPVLHYSVSREDLLVAHPADIKPDMETLLNTGYKKQSLRAHSDFYWNTACNEWALSFNDNFDIMCESKMKNLASIKLFEQS